MKPLISLLAAGLAILAVAQNQNQSKDWATPYQQGLEEAKAGNWSAARTSFLAARAARPVDDTKSSRVEDNKVWRGGVPYSPNFAAAYSMYKMAMQTADNAERTALLMKASKELETLMNAKQRSPQTYFTLFQCYVLLRDMPAQERLQKSLKSNAFNWKVDTEFVDKEEANAAAQIAFTSPTSAPSFTVIQAEDLRNPNTPGNTVRPGPTVERVPTLGSKYALIIGNSESRLPDGRMEFAASDALLLRNALTQYAGYDESNVEVVINGTADQIRASASALSQRMPSGATLFLYYAGPGVNIDGKDWLPGVDTEFSADSSSMLNKASLFSIFIEKGTKIFSFFQSNRPVSGGHYFGQDLSITGSYSQMMGCIPGGSVYALVRNEQKVGVFTQAMIDVFMSFRNNQVQIGEFGWQVYYSMKQGTNGTDPGSSPQTPTLPTPVFMSSDSKF